MKILHFADAHLGRDDSGPIVPETGLSTRLTDYLNALDRIVQYVEQDEIDLVLFCGDAFDSKIPTPTLTREWARRIRRIASWVPVVHVIGNHVMPMSFNKAHPLEIYNALQVENVYIVDRPHRLVIDTQCGLVEVVGIPWPTRHNVMASEKLQGVAAEQVDQLIAQTVTETIARLAKEADPRYPTILAGHLEIEGGDMGGGTPVGIGGGITLPLEAVALPQFDYVALGHLHRYQILHEHPYVVYSGSIERNDFGEEKEEKGFVVVDIGKDGDGAYFAHEFVELSARGFRTIRVSLDGTDPTTAVTEAIAAEDVADKVVRVIIDGTAEQMAVLDEKRVYDLLSGTLKADVVRQVERAARMRLDGQSYQEMGVAALLEAYFTTLGKSPEEMETLLERAEGLIHEQVTV